jgi:hypothetical protein
MRVLARYRAAINDRPGEHSTGPNSQLDDAVRRDAAHRQGQPRSDHRRGRPILERAGPCEQLIAEVGVVPVTPASGKSRSVTFRHATNGRARIAVTTFADNSRHGSDWAAKIYADVRDRHKRRPHAVRILARAWLRVIYACWCEGTC